jgi:predicted lipid-binding transport protein (Tim44 family)
MLRFGRFRFLALLSALFVGLTLVSVDFAEARRGGSFGSRGTRTYQAPPATRTAPNQAAPVERSMTPAPAPNAASRQPQAVGQQRPGMFNGLGGSLMRGLLIGGLFGMLLGYGFGGMAGMLGFLLQLALIGVLVWLAMAFFRSRRAPAMAGGAPVGAAGPGFGREPLRRDAAARPTAGPSARGPSMPSLSPAGPAATRDIELDQADLDTFERRLAEVQDAYSREDHAALRRLSTPEMVSYFSEELADNAKRGQRNDVTDVHLVQADIAEAWREGNEDYATAALRYESIDVMRDRATGEVVAGDGQPNETVELWTFVRPQGGDWKLSAIQEA